ncbi:hypothetical protein [Herbidospora mongoliensis]|nr:hypothetical protein [Herbidospora mongoliensis]
MTEAKVLCAETEYTPVVPAYQAWTSRVFRRRLTAPKDESPVPERS